MRNGDMKLNQSEAALIQLLRQEDYPDFTVRIERKAGYWFVTIQTTAAQNGDAPTFDEAFRECQFEIL